jgi:hypothetical protein
MENSDPEKMNQTMKIPTQWAQAWGNGGLSLQTAG